MSITKKYREKLDSLIQNAKSIKNSPETTLAWRSLQLAKAWLGKSLSYLGTPTPYAPATTVDAIPPTADVSTEPSTLGTDYLANVNSIRGSIQGQIDAIEANRPAEERQRKCWDKCIEHLTEAKFWYGFELAEMREKAVSEVKGLFTDYLNHNSDITNILVEKNGADEMKSILPELNIDTKSFIEKAAMSVHAKESKAILGIPATGRKISEDENTSSKEEPSDTTPKKG